MPIIPEAVNSVGLPGLERVSQGKVREMHRLKKKGHRLTVTSPRVSGFDFVLNARVPKKGEVLCAMNHFWVEQFRNFCPQDVLAVGSGVDAYLPTALRGNPDLWKIASVIRVCERVNLESVVRGYLTGGGWKTYLKTAPRHRLCGHRLEAGLSDGVQFETPLWTPTTKSEIGHDLDIPVQRARRSPFGNKVEHLSLALYNHAQLIAKGRGIIIADTKFEFGIWNGKLVLIDERFTPDSSRFWPADEWNRLRGSGKSPSSKDKQWVRKFLIRYNVDCLDPENPDHVKRVHALEIPEDVIQQTTRIYREIFWWLTRVRLEQYQQVNFGVKLSDSVPPPVEVLLGSESDLPQVESGFAELRKCHVPFRVHIVSCHRNPEVLRRYAEDLSPNTGLVIAAAGKAAALPGMLNSWLRHFGKWYIPVVGVALQGNTQNANNAALLSISELPGNPCLGSRGWCVLRPRGLLAGLLRYCSQGVHFAFGITKAGADEPHCQRVNSGPTARMRAVGPLLFAALHTFLILLHCPHLWRTKANLWLSLDRLHQANQHWLKLYFPASLTRYDW